MRTRRVDRRTFLQSAAALAATLAPWPVRGETAGRPPQEADDEDARVFLATMAFARQRGLAARPLGEAMAAVGRSFVGVPYVAHSLEGAGPERLVVNLRAFDCTTFMENVLVLSRCIRKGWERFEEFTRELQFVRYRGGVIEGYPSRLHYFTDWMLDNQTKGVVRDATLDLGGVRYAKTINYMTTHRDAYRQLANSDFVEKIQIQEHRLSMRKHIHVPKSLVGEAQGRLQDGDIIGISTAIEGIDVSHVGLAVHDGGTVRFLHAPLSGGAVQITGGDLAAYVASAARNTGIVVARPVEPGAPRTE